MIACLLPFSIVDLVDAFLFPPIEVDVDSLQYQSYTPSERWPIAPPIPSASYVYDGEEDHYRDINSDMPVELVHSVDLLYR